MKLLSPFAPHMTSEIWEDLGYKDLDTTDFPTFIEKLTIDSEITVVFQINGKLKSKALVPKDASKAEIEKIALADEKIIKLLEGKEVKRVIVVPGRLVNIVAK